MQIRFSVFEASLGGGEIQIGGLYFLGELLADRLFDLSHVDGQQAGDDAHVHHVLDEFAQLGFRTDGGDQLVVGNGVKDEIVAQFVQSERFVVQHGGAGSQRHRVFLRGLRIHGHQEIDFLLASDVAVLVGANRVPGRKAGDVRREHVLAGDGHAHLENAAQQHGV